MPSSTTRAPLRALEIMFLVLLLGLVIYRFGPELRTRTALPAPAPDLEVVTLAGDTVRLRELRGTVVLVNFWATWCAPCRVEMPALQRVWEDHREQGFLVLGLYTDAGVVADLVTWFRDAGVAYPFARATPAAVRGFGHGGTLPTSFLVDRAGRIVERVEGVYPEDRLRERLDRLLAEPAPTADPTDSSR